VSATAFTFCPYVSAHTPHIQLLMVFAFPLVLLAYHRMAEMPTVGRGVGLGGALAVAALSCGYYGVFAGCALALMALLLGRRSPRYWRGLGVALVTAGVLVYPVYRVFVNARRLSGAPAITHGADAQGWSANLSSYLASSAAAHAWWLPALQAWHPWVDVLFPGFAVIGLAAVGTVATRRTRHARHVRAYLVLAAVAAWASFGPDAGLYRVPNAVVPGMSLLRAPARFGIVVTFALAVVAGFGVVRLSRGRRWLPALLVVLVASELGVRTEAWGWPSWPLRVVPPLSPAYEQLAHLPRGVLVEFQFPYVSSNFHNHGAAMFWSTYHWQPMVNGYSDLVPPDFVAIARPINGFPDPASFAIMRARQVRYVLWHMDFYRGEGERIIEQRLARYAAYLRPLVKTEDIWLYEITGYPDETPTDTRDAPR
jgi:hypothetical protein